MVNVNHVIVGGRLTSDPKNIGSDDNPVVVFSIAINRKYKKKSTNEEVNEVTYLDCKAFNGPGKTILQYCKKARSLLIEGRLQLEKWTGPDNSPRSKLRVIIQNFHFLDYPPKTEATAVPVEEVSASSVGDEFDPAF